MSKKLDLIIEEVNLIVDYLLSIFKEKYRNELYCYLVGLPFVYFYDHPVLIRTVLL